VFEIHFLEGKYGPDVHGDELSLTRGWPFPFMAQERWRQAGSLAWLQPVSPWSLTSKVISFSPVFLLADSAVCLGLVAWLTIFYQRWRKKRQRIWQLHLRDSAMLLVIAGCAMAWVANDLRIARQEKTIVNCLVKCIAYDTTANEELRRNYLNIVRSPSGPVWVRELTGERWFLWRDKIFGIHVPTGGLECASQLSSVSLIDLHFTNISEAELKWLRTMQNLRAVDARWSSCTPSSSVSIDADGFDDEEQHERNGMALLCQALSQLPDLEAIQLNETYLDDHGLIHLGQISTLRLLAMSETDVSDRGLCNLTSLKRLEVLHIGSEKITDLGLVSLANLTELRILNLRGCEIQGDGLKHLENLKQLTQLELPKMDPSAINRLKHALPKVEIWQ
jgi:hypothetical protein